MEDLLEAEDYLASCDISSTREHYQTAKEKNSDKVFHVNLHSSPPN